MRAAPSYVTSERKSSCSAIRSMWSRGSNSRICSWSLPDESTAAAVAVLSVLPCVDLLLLDHSDVPAAFVHGLRFRSALDRRALGHFAFPLDTGLRALDVVAAREAFDRDAGRPKLLELVDD